MGQQLRDAEGKVLGYFLTDAEYTRMMYDVAKAESARQEAEDREPVEVQCAVRDVLCRIAVAGVHARRE